MNGSHFTDVRIAKWVHTKTVDALLRAGANFNAEQKHDGAFFTVN